MGAPSKKTSHPQWEKKRSCYTTFSRDTYVNVAVSYILEGIAAQGYRQAGAQHRLVATQYVILSVFMGARGQYKPTVLDAVCFNFQFGGKVRIPLVSL